MLSIAVLGPVEVRRDGALVPLPSGKPTEVLVRLAIDAGAPVSGCIHSMMLGEITTAAADEAVRLLTPIDDSWGLVHAEAMLAAIAQADHRFGDASHYLEHAAGQLQAASETLTRAATSDDADADLEAIIDQARVADDHDVEVVVLDALALPLAQRGELRTAQQLLATADDAAPAAVNAVDEVDRLDAHRARELIRSEAQRECQ